MRLMGMWQPKRCCAWETMKETFCSSVFYMDRRSVGCAISIPILFKNPTIVLGPVLVMALKILIISSIDNKTNSFLS